MPHIGHFDHFTDEEEQYLSLSTYNSISASGDVDDPLYMLVMKSGAAEGLCPDGHGERFGVVTSNMPNMQSAVMQSLVRSPARGSSASGTSLPKVLSGMAKVANVANQVLGGGGGGGGGVGDGYYNGNSGGGGFDTSGFPAGLQQQTWSTTSDAAGDPIQ